MENSLIKKENILKKNPEELLEFKPYFFSYAKKEKNLLPVIKQQLHFARKNNKFIKNFFDKEKIDIEKIDSLCNVPYIPVQMFKHFDLTTCQKKDVARILKSSGTTSGLPSRVFLNKETVRRQTKALTKTLSDYLGKKRKIFLVIDHKGINEPNAEINARTAGVRGLSVYAQETFYLLKEINGQLEIDFEILEKIRKWCKDKEVYIFGFTYIIWSIFCKQFKDTPIKPLSFKSVSFFHSGGWKKLETKKVSKKEFNEIIGKIFNIAAKNIHEFYGMAEQSGTIFIDCEKGYKHVPNFSAVIVRDIQSLLPAKTGAIGFIEVLSILGDSYYSQAVLTEDKGKIIGRDNCSCGRKGEYFVFVSRAEKAEVRGCGDTFKENKKYD